MERTYGLILTPPEPDHYILGGSSALGARQVLMPAGHGWAAYAPAPELQSRHGLETMNCTSYGTLNALETLARAKGYTDFPTDCSERYCGILTGTTPAGNDPHKVIESIRKAIGVIPESVLPFRDSIDTWEAYYSPSPMEPALLEIGMTMLEKFTVGHEWVLAFGHGFSVAKLSYAIKNAMQYGTVCVAVYAWERDQDGLYRMGPDDLANHWGMLLDYEDGKGWTFFDHYDQTVKKLRWDSHFAAAKVYYLDRRPYTPRPTFGRYFWDILIDRVRRGFAKALGALMPAV
jgi:hypothetical protein